MMQALGKHIPELDIKKLECDERSCRPLPILIEHVSELTEVMRAYAASNAEMTGMTLGFRSEVQSLTEVVKRMALAEERRLERADKLAAALRKPLLDWALKLLIGGLSLQGLLSGLHTIWH